METLHWVALLFSFFLLTVYKFISDRVKVKNLPPGPPGLPIIGNYHQWKRSPRQLLLKNLATKYGPIFFLRLGSRPILVISSPTAVEECFTKNDIIFANRPHFTSRKVFDYDFTTLPVASYGRHWRNLRRLTAVEIFSSTRLQMSSNIREEEIHFLVKQMCIRSKESELKVDIGSFFYMLTFNIMIKMVSGRRYFNDYIGSETTTDISNDLRQMFSPTIRLLLGDFFPFLTRLTSSKEKKNDMELHRKRERFLQDLINSSRDSDAKSGGEKRRSLIDVMLSLQESEPNIYTETVIKGIILMVLVSGPQTTASTLEAAILHLTEHPEVFGKAREEIDNNIGHSRLLDDSDLSKLPFLDCIIYETIRLGSTGPIISPHESSEECTVGGYTIPKGTMLLVNAQALQRDPNLWVEPDEFKPERFLRNEVKDEGYKFIPFGFGRRQCPGASLAMRLMALSLGTLIQWFDWRKSEANYEDESVEANLRKAEEGPIMITFRPRKALSDALSNP